MKIRTHLSILSAFSVLLILAIAAMTLYTFSLTDKQHAKEVRANEIIKSTFELNIITYDYLMHHEERMQKQWLQKYESLGNLLARMKKKETHAPGLLVLESITTDHEELGKLFLKLQDNFAKRTQLIAKNIPLAEIQLSLDLAESLTVQASMRSLGIMAETFKLYAMTGRQIMLAQTRYKRSLLFFILVFAVVFTFASFFSARAITRPIKKLTKGAGIVGEGDLEHRIEIKAKGEIGELAVAFNQMTEKRKVAENEIRKLNEELEQRVSERTAQLEVKSNLLESINKVFRETLKCDTDEEVARICLSVAEKLTGSRFGYIGEVNKAGRFDTIAISNPGWDACNMPQSEATVLINDMELVSYWGRAIKEGRTQIVNDPAADPDSGGIPEGHPPITSFIGVPLKRGANTTGLIALANKESGYSEADRQNLEALSMAFIEALHRTRALMAIRGLNKSLNGKTIELAAANKELEAFSYSVSHDLRAPLRSIDGFSHALLEDYREKLDEQGKDYLQRVRAASQRMAALIDDMLTLSRITRSEMKRGKVDLSALVQSVDGELRQSQPGRNVEFTIQEGVVVDGDETLLRLVIENLLGNAWKFTAKHPSAMIEFGVKEHDGQPAYFVQDNGAGFDMAYADKLFSAFQRLHKMTEFPGTGVGLASAKRIISRHGGAIWAEGEVEKGATFYFNLTEKRTTQ